MFKELGTTNKKEKLMEVIIMEVKLRNLQLTIILEEGVNVQNNLEYELKILSNIDWEVNFINIAKDAFVEGKDSEFYHNCVDIAQSNLKKIRTEIRIDHNLSKSVKSICLNSIRCALVSCNDFHFYVKAKVDKDKSNLKKTTFYYIKKYLNRFSAKSISKNKILSDEEKILLLTKKGIVKPENLLCNGEILKFKVSDIHTSEE